MKKAAFALVLLAAAAAAACGGSGKSAGSDTLDVTLPVWTVPPGQEMLKCVYQKLTNDSDLYVDKFVTIQGNGGHHILAFISTTNLPDGTEVDCNSPQSMESWRPLLTGTDKTGFTLASGFAIHIPPHAQLVWQSHYVNASNQTISTSDKISVRFVPKTPNLTLVQTFSNTKLGFDVPPGSLATDGIDCVAPQDMNVFLMFGHMHEWGKRITVAVGPTATDVTPIYDITNWSAAYRDAPPNQIWPFNAPFVIHQGDHVKLTCNWDNTQGSTDLLFPQEMCATVFWFYPGTDSLICSD